MNKKRPGWQGLAAALRYRGRRGAKLYLNFRHAAREQPRLQLPEFDPAGLLTADELRRLQGARVLFTLPSASQGGGTRVVLTESRCLRALGIDVWIANLEGNRARFEALRSREDVPTVYVRDYQSVKALVREFDVVIATAWQSTAVLAALGSITRAPTLAYYVQDYEPYFYAQDTDEHRGARASYHVSPQCVLLTKTAWNQQEVLRNEGVRSAVVGASYDPVTFNAVGRAHGRSAIRISAMVRPETPHRAPGLTLSVLKSLQQRFAQRVSISIFGCTREALDCASLDAGFAFEHLGILNANQVAQLMRRSDVFLDLSSFQAMGLTAMEAMACGVAIIGPLRGGLSEIVQHGVSGVLVDTCDAAACVQAASALIDDPAQIDRLAAEGSKAVAAHSPDKVAARVARLLLLQHHEMENRHHR